MSKKKNPSTKTNWSPLISLAAFIYGGYLLFTNYISPTYVGFQCDYQSSVFQSNLSTTLKDACMKDGNNRFKTYFRKEFSSKEECMDYVRYSKEITVPEGYLVDCEKK